MDVTARLLRFAAGRPHPLIVAVPGETAARLAAEAEVRRRAWPEAISPAGADLLVVAGEPGPRLRAAIEEVWAAMPGPRARVFVREGVALPAALSRGQQTLMDVAGQRADAAARGEPAQPGHEDRGTVSQQGGVDEHDGHGDTEDSAHVHGGTDQGEMELPAGLPMADRADDRDGLKLDQLHVPLGPVLPEWPAGLAVRLTLQGDVVQQADVETYVELDRPPAPFWNEPWLHAGSGRTVSRGEAARRRCAAYLDSLARLLGVAGWAAAAMKVRGVRDDLLAGTPAPEIGRRLRTLLRRVGGSRTLRWSTNGIGIVAPGSDLSSPDEAWRIGGDVTARWERWLRGAVAAVPDLDDSRPLSASDAARLGEDARLSRDRLNLLPRLLQGTELAAARLIVASLDPDLDALAPVTAGEPARG